MKGPILALALLGGAISSAAVADVHVGVAVGHGWGYRPMPIYRPYLAPRVWVAPYYRMPPVYYAPPVVTVAPPAPVVYVERNDLSSSSSAPDSDWYYCRQPQGYYPNVDKCPSGWLRAPARPRDGD